MKKARDDHKINTIPKGVYESGTINQDLRKNKNENLNSKTTDLQGNGYPINQDNDSKIDN